MIEAAIREALLANLAIATAATGGVYVQVKDNQKKGLYILVTDINGQRPVNVQLEAGQNEALIQISIYGEQAKTVAQVKESVIGLFNGAGVASAKANVQVGLLKGARPGYEPKEKIFSQILDFKFYYH